MALPRQQLDVVMHLRYDILILLDHATHLLVLLGELPPKHGYLAFALAQLAAVEANIHIGDGMSHLNSLRLLGELGEQQH